MTITKNELLNWYSSMQKNWKDPDNVWHRKLTLKVKILQFLTTFTQMHARFKKIYRALTWEAPEAHIIGKNLPFGFGVS